MRPHATVHQYPCEGKPDSVVATIVPLRGLTRVCPLGSLQVLIRLTYSLWIAGPNNVVVRALKTCLSALCTPPLGMEIGCYSIDPASVQPLPQSHGQHTLPL